MAYEKTERKCCHCGRTFKWSSNSLQNACPKCRKKQNELFTYYCMSYGDRPARGTFEDVKKAFSDYLAAIKEAVK